MINLLIIDDDRNYTKSLKLGLEDDFNILIAHTINEAKSLIFDNVDVVILDINFGKGNNVEGLKLLSYIKSVLPLIPVLMISIYDDPEIIIKSFRQGADDYIIKGKNSLDDIIYFIRENINKKKIMQSIIKEKDKFAFVGKSYEMIKIKEECGKVSNLDTTILITGETGVGKEVVARYIHKLSNRNKMPFVGVNITSLSKDIIESELFGYKKGAFTGAVADKKGFIESANGGTLFIDEIGDLPLNMQVKLLRFIETKSIIKVGDTRKIDVDVRLIFATNKNLKKMVERGEFREDLYYRINVYEINVPPLRERKEDIPLLVDYYINKFNEDIGSNIKGVEKDAMDRIMKYFWFGNVRELKNVIESSIIKASIDGKEMISASHIPSFDILNEKTEYIKEGEIDIEKEMAKLFIDYVEEYLKINKGNKTETARQLGFKDDDYLRYRIRSYYKKWPELFDEKEWIIEKYSYVMKRR